MGNDLLADINDWVDARFMVGIHDPRVGRILGMGPSGKLCINAMVGYDRVCAFDHGAKKKGNVSHVECPHNDIWIYAGTARNVYKSWWSCPICSFLCRIYHGVDFSSIHGSDVISCFDVVCS